MSIVGRWNLIFGFSAILFSACGGFFLATEQSRHFAENAVGDPSWWFALSSSAHGHTCLFGILHVLLGLTFAYSSLGSRFRLLQSICLGSGTFAMSALMIIRSLSKPAIDFDTLGVFIGLFLSLAILSLLIHVYSLLPLKRGGL